MCHRLPVISLILLLFSVALASSAETREERQARSIAVLRAGVLARPMVELAPEDVRFARPAFFWSSATNLPADDLLADPIVIEPCCAIEDGYVIPQRVHVPPVTHHISRASRQVYPADRSPHNDRGTATFVRSWGRGDRPPGRLAHRAVRSLDDH